MNPEPRAGMTRRQALALAGLGALGAGVGVTGVLRGGGEGRARSGTAGTAGGDEVVEPDVLSSAEGLLDVTLTAAVGPVALAGQRVQALSYNGSVPGPTLRLRPGDRVRLALQNRLGAPTNLHVHGLHVSPQGNGDNAFVHIPDGDTFQYEYEIPPDHPAGTFWYHPHLHGRVADQLWGGLVGAIIVERGDEVALPVERERVLVITDVTLDGDRVVQVGMPDRMMGRQGELVLVNGQREPTLTVQSGRYERWRVVNACSARFLRLRLDGAELVQVAGDAGSLAEPRPVEDLLLVTGNRAEVLVRLPQDGAYQLVAEPVDRGSAGMGSMMGGGGRRGDEPVILLHVQATGVRGQGERLPEGLADLDDLRGLEVAGRRSLTFAMGMGMGGGMGRGMGFTIDGKEFDADRIDTSVEVGAVEEWTITNDSPMDHPFHLHVWPMQVVARDRRSATGSPEWLDVVNVPARGEVAVRVRFADFDGRTVYHCHILDHEDLGMMGVVQARR